jgi:hypothetical protein
MTPSSTTLTIHQSRLLAELPHFFQSLDSALAECLQNSTRSGASTVAITADPMARIVTIQDDGPGVAHPADLWTAAASGWDNPTIIEPAGLGFYAILGLSDPLMVTSRAADGSGWTATIPATAFRGTAFAVEPLPVDPTAPAGLRLEAHLRPEAHLSAILDALHRVPIDPYERTPWRHTFPLRVTWTTIGHNAVDLPPVWTPTPDQPTIATLIGSVYNVENVDRPFPSGHRAWIRWEHRLIPWERGTLLAAIRAQTDADTAADVIASLPSRLIWDVLPTVPVRPQLPERAAMITDTAWHDAVQALAHHIIQAFDRPGRQAQAHAHFHQVPAVLRADKFLWNIPASIEALPLCDDYLPPEPTPFFSTTADQWMTWAGYTAVWVPDLISTEGDWRNHSGNGRDVPDQKVWMRNPPQNPDARIVDACNAAGYWTQVSHDPNAPQRTVRYTPPTWLPDPIDGWLTIGYTPEIVVETDGQPVGTLSCLIHHYDRDTIQLIFAHAPQDAWPSTDADLEAWPFGFLLEETGCAWDYVGDDDEDAELDLSGLHHQILRHIEATWNPDQARARRRKAERVRLQQQFWETQQALAMLHDIPGLPASVQTHIAALRAALPEAEAAVLAAKDAPETP